MHPFLNWMLNSHRGHRCLAPAPSRWGVSCSVRWPRGPAFYVLDCDRCPDFQNRKRPDFLLFLERRELLLIVVLELTEGTVRSDKRDQIEAGLQKLEEYLNAWSTQSGGNVSPSVHGFVLHNVAVRNADLHSLRRPLPFRGKTLSLVVDRCGRRLSDLLNESPSVSRRGVRRV